MTHTLSAAQQTQMDNRDSTGQWKQKTHAETENPSDVLGLSEPDSPVYFTAETREEVFDYHRSAGAAPTSEETDRFIKAIDDQVNDASAGSEVSSESIAETLNDGRLEDGIFSDDTQLDITAADVQPMLSELRNDGFLHATPHTAEYGHYEVPAQRRPYAQGTPISYQDMAARLSTGQQIEVDLWQTSEGYDTPFALEDTARIDGFNHDNGHLLLVNGENDLADDYGDYTIPAGLEDASITETKDGRITIDVPERTLDSGKVSPGARYSLRVAGEDSWTGVRPLTDEEGRESPFDVGPRQYRQDLSWGAGDYERVALTQDVYDPHRGKIGSIYQADEGWALHFADPADEPMMFEEYDDPQEAAQMLYRHGGGNKNWANPTAENVPLPGI